MNRKNPKNRTNQQQLTYQTETVWLPWGIAISMTAAQRPRSAAIRQETVCASA
jgi:hypothetical protein